MLKGIPVSVLIFMIVGRVHKIIVFPGNDIIINSSHFRQAILLRVIHENHGIRLIGPNTSGMINVHEGLNLVGADTVPAGDGIGR